MVVRIVNKGKAVEVLKASKRRELKRTIINGRGSGIYENAKLLALLSNQKRNDFTVVERENSNEILKSIRETVKLDEEGAGIAFVLNVEKR